MLDRLVTEMYARSAALAQRDPALARSPHHGPAGSPAQRLEGLLRARCYGGQLDRNNIKLIVLTTRRYHR